MQLALSRLFVDLHWRLQRVLTYPTREGGDDRDAEQMWRIDGAMLQVFGQGVLRLDLGPVAVMVRVLLWSLPVFYAPYTWTKDYFA